MIVLDAGAVIAFQQPADAHHERAVQIIANARPAFLMHTMTLAEVLVGPARTGREHEAEADLVSLGVRCASLGPGEATLLARTRALHGLTMPDTCVLATAIHARMPIMTFDDRLAAAADRLGLLHY